MTQSLTFLAHWTLTALALEAFLGDAEAGSLSVWNTIFSELVAWPASKSLRKSCSKHSENQEDRLHTLEELSTISRKSKDN